MKVIFLDIDGVINSELYYKKVNRKVKNWNRFNPESVDLLKKLVEEFDAKIVISSSWRFGAKKLLDAELKKSCLIGYLHKDCETPHIYGSERGAEIKLWIDRHPEIEKYVILDDYPDMLEEQNPYFVKTSIHIGFLEEHYNMARAVLASG